MLYPINFFYTTSDDSRSTRGLEIEYIHTERWMIDDIIVYRERQIRIDRR